MGIGEWVNRWGDGNGGIDGNGWMDVMDRWEWGDGWDGWEWLDM